MLLRKNIQNNDSLTIKRLCRVPLLKMKQAVFNHLILFFIQHDFSTNPSVLCHIMFCFWRGFYKFFLFSCTLDGGDTSKVVTADKTRLRLLLVFCSFSFFLGPKLWAFPICLNVFHKRSLFKKLSPKIWRLICGKAKGGKFNLTLIIDQSCPVSNLTSLKLLELMLSLDLIQALIDAFLFILNVLMFVM